MAQENVSDQSEVKQDTLTLGQHLSAVLNYPNLPVGLYVGIWDRLGEIPTADLMDEPEFLDKLLKLGQKIEREKARQETAKAVPFRVNSNTTAGEPDQSKTDEEPEANDEPDLRLSIDQFRRLQKVWWAIGEISEMASAPENDGGGLECLKIVNDQGLGEIMAKLQAQIDLRKKGGAA